MNYLWLQRSEGIEFLDDLLVHFNAVNDVNTSKNFNSKYGESEIFFGKIDSYSKDVDSMVDKRSVFLEINNVSCQLDSEIFSVGSHIVEFKPFDPVVSSYNSSTLLSNSKYSGSEFKIDSVSDEEAISLGHGVTELVDRILEVFPDSDVLVSSVIDGNGIQRTLFQLIVYKKGIVICLLIFLGLK